MKSKSIIWVLFLVSGFIFHACSPRTTNGIAPVKRGNVSGNWTVAQVTYEGIPESSIKTIFNDSAPKCFIGSVWLLTNSGNGSYTLPGGTGCVSRTQKIFWSVSPADETFQFKKLEDGEKAREVTDGYRLVLSAANNEMMTLKLPIEAAGNTAYAVLHLSKTN